MTGAITIVEIIVSFFDERIDRWVDDIFNKHK